MKSIIYGYSLVANFRRSIYQLTQILAPTR
jgi:hypothetical protein